MPRRILTTENVGLDEELDLLHDRLDELALPAVAPHVAPPSPVSGGGGQASTMLDDLDDVNAGSPAANDALVWVGSEWENAPVVNSIDGLTGDVQTEFWRGFMLRG